MKKRNSILTGAGMLTAMSIASKFIGALHRVPLTNIVGAEGIGLYQMVFPLYTVLLNICGGGMVNAIARLTAKNIASGREREARRTVKYAMIPMGIISLASFLLVICLHRFIARVQGNPLAWAAYLGIAPSLLFVSGISALRGYYQGRHIMLPSGVSQLVEQIIKLFAGLELARILLPYGVEYAVLGALLGVSLSELCALLLLFFQYSVSEYKYRKKRFIKFNSPVFETAAEFPSAEVPLSPAPARDILRELYAFAIPVMLGSLVIPVTQMIDSVMVINLLGRGGFTLSDATALFGLMVGPVGTLINLPVVIVLSVSVVLLPKVTEAVTKERSPCAAVGLSLRLCMVFVIPVIAAFMFFPHEIITLLYRKGLSAQQIQTGAQILRVESASIIYISIIQVTTAVLQGYNVAHKPAINLLIGACVKIVSTPLLILYAGVYGAAAATVLCYTVTAFLNVLSVRKTVRLNLSFIRVFLLPLLCASAAFSLGFVTLVTVGKLTGTLYAFVTAILCALVIYGALLLITKTVNPAMLKPRAGRRE